jgi:predicted ATPase/DNA-binding SARP family transcriptional activator/tetratricopeptide (TPR) repeat protein
VSEAKSHRKALKLRLFGPMQACLGEKPLPPLRSRKGEWLLALLALRNAPVSRSWLAGTLWPESEESRALLYLRRELMHLRQALGPECGRLLSPGRSLQLDLTGADCDLLTFDAAITRGDESSLEVAVSLYGGPLLEGCDEEWVILERQSREQAHLTALERLAESAYARGDTPAAVSRLRSVVALDPLRETTQRALMKALADSGDSAAAVQVYRDLRLYLRRELNAEVDPETTSLFHGIRDTVRRRSQPASRAVRTDRGARITRIPSPLTPLVGRNQERWEVRRRLGNCRLLTLTGTGGVGKTRLAIEIAEEMKEDFAGGVCFVELAALTDAALVPQAVMDGIGLKPNPGRNASEALADRLKSSDLLLVLDNCEHLAQPCAKLAGTLLGACAHLRILTTSREPLGIAGESVWRVPSLSVPPATDHLGNRDKNLVAEVMEYEAVTLFVERAQQARSDFALTVHNVESVSRVCRRLDGIPLAIELAAARVRSLTVEDIDGKLDQRFGLLTGGSRTALPRQKTLRSLIDWSYDLLNEPEKALLCRLSVFAGGWTVEAAEQVCAGTLVAQWEVLDLLTSLADKNLIVAETFGPSVRYRLLETMRQYARDRLLESGDSELWRGRHLEYFLALAEEALPHLTSVDHPTWLELLETEHDNLRSALAWSSEGAGSAESGLRLAASLWRFWDVRGYLGEGRGWLAALLDSEGLPVRAGDGRSAARARALNGAGVLAWRQGDYPAARALHEESLAIMRELDHRRGIAGSLNNLGNVAYEQADFPAARAFFAESLAIMRELGHRGGIAAALGNLGVVAKKQGDDKAAWALYEESLSIQRELGDRWGIATSLQGLGSVAHDQGDYHGARALHEECGAIMRELGDRGGIATALEALAPALAALGSPGRAARLFGTAERLREEIGVPRPPNERPEFDKDVGAVRAALGDDTAFDRAWAEGRVMTLEQAVELALNGPEA